MTTEFIKENAEDLFEEHENRTYEKKDVHGNEGKIFYDYLREMKKQYDSDYGAAFIIL